MPNRFLTHAEVDAEMREVARVVTLSLESTGFGVDWDEYGNRRELYAISRLVKLSDGCLYRVALELHFGA